MLFDDPASLEPGDVLNWFNLCSAGLAREEQQGYRLLGAEPDVPAPQFLFDLLGVGASRADIRKYFMACGEELASRPSSHSLRLRRQGSARIANGRSVREAR
jgi:hypothetical protein